jgi:hypothetical protein
MAKVPQPDLWADAWRRYRLGGRYYLVTVFVFALGPACVALFSALGLPLDQDLPLIMMLAVPWFLTWFSMIAVANNADFNFRCPRCGEHYFAPDNRTPRDRCQNCGLESDTPYPR